MLANIRKVSICFLLTLFFGTAVIGQSREIINMDFDWKFTTGDHPGAEELDLDDNSWRQLNLPHDWSIEGTFVEEAAGGKGAAFLPTGTGWYRKHFLLTTNDLERTVWIEFGGVYMNSDVWINGHHLGNHPYGYTSFYYDMTPYLKKGENVLAVRVDNSAQPSSRWYAGSGIYRHVNMVKMAPVHFAHWGVFLRTTNVQENNAVLMVKYQVENAGNDNFGGTIHAEVLDSSGQIVAIKNIPFLAESEKQVQLECYIQVPSPRLWSPDQPALYRLKCTLLKNKNAIDALDTDFGIREARFDIDHGLILNGKQVKINGVGVHHDGGCVGAAVPDDVWIRRLQLLKEMGCNAIRTAHNPPSASFLALCDQMGFLVLDEAYDEWAMGKIDHGYAQYFDEWGIKDLTSMIMRDRNHPSVIIWSLGNEILDQRLEEGIGTLKKLAGTARKLDPSRPVTVACPYIGDEGPKGPSKEGFLDELDIVGYNYVDRWNTRRELYYSIDKLEHPDWKFMGTENVSINGDRGDYSLGNDPEKVHASYNSRMVRVEENWKFVATHDYVIGDFLWTGFDHLGERPWPRKSTSWGIIDYCGFPKDAYYFYKSQWTEEPMAHLFPHWNWPKRKGQTIPVLCYTNCDTVELFLNGKSLGEKSHSFPKKGMVGRWKQYESPRIEATTSDLHLSWDVPYEPGTLMAVGKKNGKEVVEKIRTTGAAKAIRLVPDKETLKANSRSVCHFVVKLVDKNGLLVPDDETLINFTLQGPGKIIGVGNGDPRDHLSHQSKKCNTYRGLCLVVVQATGQPGEITLTAESASLKKKSISINSVTNKES